MLKSKWELYTVNEIKPCGWLRTQLSLQANGLAGNLHKVWRDVRDSKWINGDAEGWERVPYWLDGFIPLAYLLENDEMIADAKKYVDAILANQQADGWICPCTEEERTTYDTWVVMLISKVLTVYYECSRDERIPDVLYRVLKNYYDLLSSGKIRLFDWARARWYECFIAINKIYDIYHEEWIVRLAEILSEQGLSPEDCYDNWKTMLNKWTFETHIVNMGMMLKSEAVSCDILGQPYKKLADERLSILKKYNGTPVGLFTGDECLAGLSPIRGTELCAVVDQMYSYELLYAYTGDKKWAENLELLAFNGLPATVSDDMWTHQYDQMSNQINCIRFPGKPVFGTNGSEAHLFGLEPNYGCCTANFGQGWPKFALSAFMHKGNKIINAVPVPSELKTEVGGKAVSITLETEYPFKNKFRYNIVCDADAEFDFVIRIPGFAKDAVLCGKPVAAGKNITVKIKGSTVLDLGFDTVPEFISRPHGLKSLKCGSLVFSLPIAYEKKMYEYEKNGVERKFPYCDYEYIGVSDWNYAFASDDTAKTEKDISPVPFSSEQPPVVIKAKMKKIGWGLEPGYETVCASVPKSRKPVGEPEEKELYPYGCAKLRMTEMPMVK